MSLLTKLRKLMQKMRMLPKAWAQASPGTLRRKLVAPAGRRVRRTVKKAAQLRLAATDRLRGAPAGNRSFWQGGETYDWARVESRLLTLDRTHPDAIADFTRLAVATTRNPEVLINLARSALTKDALRDCLAAETLDEKSTVRARMISSQMACAGFIAAATLVLPDSQSLAFVRKANAFCPPFSPHFRRMMDSFGISIAIKPKLDGRRSLPFSGFKKRKKHRLILAQSLKDVPTLPLLFQGADAATVVVMDDLYGRADFTGLMVHAGGCQVAVEHCRSRITRFSADYHRLHEDTRGVAEHLTEALATASDKALATDDPSGTALAIADSLFFPCLQFAALEKLLAVQSFDHIAVVVGGGKGVDQMTNKSFVRLLSGIDGLARNRRVELVCLSPHSEALDMLDALVKGLATPAAVVPMPVVSGTPLDLAPALSVFESRTQSMVKGFAKWPDTSLPRVMLATTQVAAYNRSSAAYCQSLATISNLRIAFLGGNMLSFTETMDDSVSADMMTPLPHKPHHSLTLMHQWIAQFLIGQLPGITPRYVAHVMSCNLSNLARNGVLSYLAHAYLCNAWFARLAAEGQLPKAVVLTPFRSVRVAAFAQVARRYDVPSIAIEPHGLNADYCRYCKVTADYYGVISHFFAQAAVDGFGMSLDRSPVIGSPRLQGPKDYDVAAVTAATRARLAADIQFSFDATTPVLSYFTQPSDWNQISEVWRIILEATKGLDCQLVLKTHPEETASRGTAYLAIAKEMGAMDRVRLIKTDAVSLIEASDLVLSGYSATVVEAALYRRPVFCVTNGDVDYPLNQHDVIGAPFFRTAKALRADIKGFLKDATPYQATAAAFLHNEPQLLDGFAPHLSALVQDVIARPPQEALRPADEVPASLFLDGPHTVYKV